MRIIVVGGGMQGCVIAENLRARKEQPEVVIADIREPGAIPNGVRFMRLDVLSESSVAKAVENADAAVLAVPSSIARQALSNLIRTGVAVADVSFTPDPPLDLHSAARDSGACCVVDCGIAPGLSHILVGSAYTELGGLDSVRILVGGMPQDPPPAFRHAVYFNPHDLISEYVRPGARAQEDGQDIAPAPLDVTPETCVDAELGQLEAFLSDGLRSLLVSYPDLADMAELTLRWPGHLDTMKTLGKLGLLDQESAAEAIGNSFAARYAADKYPDVLLMIVEVKRGSTTRSWRLIDRKTGGQSAMSRTTGFTTAAVAMALARKQFTDSGVYPPERLGRDPGLAAAIIEDLSERGVTVRDTVLAAQS